MNNSKKIELKGWFTEWLQKFIDNFKGSIIPEKAIDIIIENLEEDDITYFDDIEEQLDYLREKLQND